MSNATLTSGLSVALTQKETWNAALRATRRRGVRVNQNVMSCCRSCSDTKDMNVWTFGGQDNAYVWHKDGLVTRKALAKFRKYPYGRNSRMEKVSEVCFYFDTVAHAQVLVEELKAHGFEVEWDGDESNAVTVLF